MTNGFDIDQYHKDTVACFPSLAKTKVAFDTEKDAHAWVQWKGTDVCLDVRCACGFLGHIDADFVYYVKCPRCQKTYECNGHIELIEVDASAADVDIEPLEEDGVSWK